MKKVLIVIGQPVFNMGSQAIVRGLVYNIKCLCGSFNVEVIATDPEIEKGLGIEGVNRYSYRYSIQKNRINLPRIINRIYFFITKSTSQELMMYHFIQSAKHADIVFIVGADNYDKSYNSLKYMNETTQFVKRIGAEKFVLYNCSVSENDLTPGVIDDFKRFQYLTARDSISYKNMKIALPGKDIRFFPDVAFCMKPERMDLPDGWEQGKMIGINLSSLVADGRYGATEEEILNAYYKMLDCIISDTDLKICFIPHVKNNADLSMLRKLYSYVEDKSRAIIINHENFNAAQIKYVISQCRLFVGARTHSTIAAYSSLVPTLVIGYSIKSVGIATDLFGTDKGNVIPVAELKDQDKFLSVFKDFLSRENEMREQLKQTIPEYIRKSEGVQELIAEILEK